MCMRQYETQFTNLDSILTDVCLRFPFSTYLNANIVPYISGSQTFSDSRTGERSVGICDDHNPTYLILYST
jgi:hypothetical protein